MRVLLQHHLHTMIDQMVDSSLPSTRAFWRIRMGYPEFADDPRPLAECAARTVISAQRPEQE